MTGRQVEPDPATLAARVAEAVRELVYATAPGGSRLSYPCDVYDVVGALKLAAERVPQVCWQLAGFLTDALDVGCVRAVDGQPYAGDPDAAVTAAVLALVDAGAAGEVMARALGSAQRATCGLAHHDPDGVDR